MTEPFLGEIKYVGFNFAPRGYSTCWGQTLSIAQNSALFALLGTQYGGNGQTTFGLPDLRSRVPIGVGTGPGLSPYVQGQQGGTENVTLLTANLPAHNHTFTSTSTLGGTTVKGTVQTPSDGVVFARGVDSNGVAVPQIFAPAGTATTANLGGLNVAGTVGVTGSNIPVSVLQPYLALLPIIALEGIFPSRN